jgi:hypothetical protein
MEKFKRRLLRIPGIPGMEKMAGIPEVEGISEDVRIN